MSFKSMLKPGKYWIGDPCYVFPHKGPMKDKWHELLNACNYFEDDMPAVIDNGKITVWAAGTAYGDGCYESNFGDNFPVDAGLIGIIPVETIEYLGRTDNNLDRLGKFVTFDSEFSIQLNAGYFRFGDITIDTGDWHCENEDYDNYDDCDEV